MAKAAAAGREERAPERIVIATPIDAAPEDDARPLSWPVTIARLALEPDQHPWSAGWRLRRRGPVTLVAVALLLLLLFALSGCASAPRDTVQKDAPAPVPARGARCESLLLSQELQVPLAGEVGDLRLTIRDLPHVTGELRVLVRQPRFPASLSLDADAPAQFGKVVSVKGQDQLTIVLRRPERASSEWPREACSACRVDVEITGLFGVREELDAFFGQALQEAAAIDDAFDTQSGAPASRPSAALRRASDALDVEAHRCGVRLGRALPAVQTALEVLDAARTRLYDPENPQLPDAAAVMSAWESATAAIDELPETSAAARSAGWPTTLTRGSRLRAAARTLELLQQAKAVPPEDGAAAARFLALALVGNEGALEERLRALPRVRDLADAEARLAWVEPRGEVPLPAVSVPVKLRVRDFRSVLRGSRCIGPGGAAPVSSQELDAQAVAHLLGADAQGRLHIARPQDVARVTDALQRSRRLLCVAPQIDVGDLFAGIEDKELGVVADRFETVFASIDRAPVHVERAIAAKASAILCKLFEPETIARHVGSVVGYRIFVEGGTRVLDTLPGPLLCGGRELTPREVRRRLRDAYRAALDRHALADRLCPMRGGKCPDEVAASVRRLFGLRRTDLARPAPESSRRLDDPPAFGFSDEWVQKLDRCAQEACDALLRLRADAPPGQFDGAVCAPRAEGAPQPQEITLDRPELPSSVTLSSCDAHAGVRITLRKGPGAGPLLSIASPQPFRFGSETVTQRGRHLQYGRIYERVADLADSGDVPRKGDGAYEVALTPTVENQVFFFSSLRRRDY